jgi:hypothetical protein
MGSAETDSGAAGVDGGPACSSGCQGAAGAGSICVVAVDAQLVDASGAGAGGKMMTVCGTNICSLPTATDSRGFAHFAICLNMVQPALKFLGGSAYVSFAAAVTSPTQTFPPATLVPLPAQGAPFPTSGGAVLSGAVALQVGPGAIAFDPTAPMDPTSLEFRAAAIDPAAAPPGLDPALGVKALWGLAPANAAIRPAAALTIPNPDPSWLPGATVDFVGSGAEASATAALPYGKWGRVGTGTVSADGKSITTDTGAGNGIGMLGIVGVAAH